MHGYIARIAVLRIADFIVYYIFLYVLMLFWLNKILTTWFLNSLKIQFIGSVLFFFVL